MMVKRRVTSAVAPGRPGAQRARYRKCDKRIFDELYGKFPAEI